MLENPNGLKVVLTLGVNVLTCDYEFLVPMVAVNNLHAESDINLTTKRQFSELKLKLRSPVSNLP